MDINEIIKRGIDNANKEAEKEIESLSKEGNSMSEETRKRLRFYSSLDMDKEWQSYNRRRKGKRSRTIWIGAIGIAASLLILVGFATFSFMQEQQENLQYALFDSSKVKPGTRKAELKAEADTYIINVPRGAEYSLVLSDGTKVWLNADSKLTYPRTFSGKERRVRLEGEGYFEVAKNQSQPFYVDLKGMSVHVTGTKFNVNARHDKPIEVTLVSGSIQMERPSGEVMATLHPNENFTAAKSAQSYSVSPADTEVDLSWHKGKFVFKDEPLSEIAQQLGAWYNIDIIVPNELRDHCYSGELDRNQTIEPLLKVLRLTGDIEFVDRGNGKMEIIKKQQ